MTRALPIATLYLVMLLSIVGLVSLPACSSKQRMKTIDTAVLTVDTARDGWLSWVRAHQMAIVEKATSREEMDAKLAAFAKKRDKVRDGFDIVLDALLHAATHTDDKSLDDALKAADELIERIKALMKEDV